MNPDRVLSWNLVASIVMGLLAVHPVTVVAESSDDLAARVLVVYNTREPDSETLAREYLAGRAIPASHLCPITVRPAETITRDEFEQRLRQPILAFLQEHGLLERGPGVELNPFTKEVPATETERSAITTIVLMYGVPVRIESDPRLLIAPQTDDPSGGARSQRTEASVDTELALLPSDDVPLGGAVPNLFFRKLTVAFEHPLNRYMMMVGRLDGPTPAVVRRMMDDALETERLGLHGRVYFDAQNTPQPGYRAGDDWLRTAAELLAGLGYETTVDERPAVLGPDQGVGDVAVYGGWYATHPAGIFANKEFRFRRGALAYHIHSFSAASVRSRTAYWVGPLLDRGAAATMGNVYEPYLGLTPHLDLFYQRLVAGGTFIEAAYNSQPGVSWQATFVGDPLYRPFKTSLDEQIQRLEAASDPDRAWAYLRKVNLLSRQGATDEARTLCEQQAAILESAILYEKLGQLRQDAGEPTQARQAWRRALALTEEQPNDALVQRVNRALDNSIQDRDAGE